MLKNAAFIPDKLRRKCRLAGDRLKIIKRQALRFPRNPKMALEYSAYRKSIAMRNWAVALDHARALGEMALESGDRRLVAEMMHAFERLGCYVEWARFRLEHRRLLRNSPAKEWRGDDLSGKTLLIDLCENPNQGLGMGYRGANFVAKASRLAAHTLVIVQPRLIPTYRRTFPGLEVLDRAEDVDDDRVDAIAFLANLVGAFPFKDDSPDPEFHRLYPDQELTARLRARYRGGGGRPMIGICWYSGHHGKLLPSLLDWQRFIESTDAQFVSLQYGDVSEDVEVLGRDRVIVDPEIDQLTDMDAFAAQVAALDGVITITATLGHVAGALGVPTVALRDDWFRREWPVMNDRVPWYPNLRVAGKDGRDWDEVLAEARGKLGNLLEQNRRRNPSQEDHQSRLPSP